MNEELRGQDAVEKLLIQDEAVSQFQYEEFRMNLYQSIERLQHQARLVHRCALCSLAMFILCVVLTPLAAQATQDWIRWGWSGFGLVALFVTGVLAAVDFYRFQPALKRKQRDSVWAAIDQLQHDVAELKNELKNRP